MSFEIGWTRRNEDGEKEKIDFKLVREDATWVIQRGRFSHREPYQPTPEDWEMLFERLAAHAARGKVRQEDIKRVERLREATG